MHPGLKWTLRLAMIPAAVAAYVTIAGLTGVCPNCKAVVDAVRGRHEPLTRPASAVESISALTAYTLEGEPVALSTHVGKPMILEFWATWCGPCHRQREILRDLPADVLVLSLSVDTDPRVVSSFLERNHTAPVELLAPPELQAAVGGISAVPTLVFVDATGAIRGVEEGVQSARRLRARLAEISSPAP
jgi:thiol-disulfide isomerase/thioredoxin